MTDNVLRTNLAAHPRLTGLLFATVLLLLQAMSVQAGGGAAVAVHGP